jgi:hypothetical protein
MAQETEPLFARAEAAISERQNGWLKSTLIGNPAPAAPSLTPSLSAGTVLFELNLFLNESGTLPELSKCRTRCRLRVTSRNTRGQQITSALASKGDLGAAW